MPEALPSTSVEQPLPRGEQNVDRHGNLHHNVPESRRGSDDDGNLTRMPVARHNGYHAWAQNMLPTEAIRFIAIESLSHPNARKRLDPRQLHDVLKTARGQELYWPKAFVPGNHQDLPTRMTQDLFHTARIMQLERQTVIDAIALIEGERDSLPPAHRFEQMESMKFFDVRTPAEAIEGILTEKQDKRLAWCNTLKFHVRHNVLATLARREGSPPADGREYLWALQEHHDTLDLRLRTIGDTATRLHDQIQQLVALSELALFTGEVA